MTRRDSPAPPSRGALPPGLRPPPGIFEDKEWARDAITRRRGAPGPWRRLAIGMPR
jgi:hypothetical protein